MTLLLRLLGLLVLLALAQLTSCATSADVATTLSLPVDSAVQQQLAYQVRAGKVKCKGPVTIQVGTGNSNVAAPKAHGPVAAGASQAQDFSKAGQHGGALATAPGASAGATTRTGVPVWALVAAGIIVLLLALLWVIRKLRGP